MGKVIANKLSLPIETHNPCAVDDADEITALFQSIQEGDFIRYNSRQIPVEVIETGMDYLVVDGERSVHQLEQYNGTKHSVRARHGDTTCPVTALAVVTKGAAINSEYSETVMREHAQSGVLWKVSYGELDSEEELQRFRILSTRLKYIGSGVVSLYNHLAGGNPIYTTVDLISDVETVIARGHIEDDVAEGDKIKVRAETGLSDSTILSGEVSGVSDVSGTNRIRFTSDTERYCVSVSEESVLLHDSSEWGSGEITRVVTEVKVV